MRETPGSGLERHQLRALLDAARLLNSTLELKEVTQIIIDVVRAEVPVERLSLFVVDSRSNKLHSLVAHGVGDAGISVPLGAGIAGTVAVTGEVLDIADAYSDARFDRHSDQKLGYYTNDLLALPVYNREGEIVAVLELLNRLRPISDNDKEFLFGISVYLGLALQNAWAHSQLRTSEQLEKQHVVLRDSLAETEKTSLATELTTKVLKEFQTPLSAALDSAETVLRNDASAAELRSCLEETMRSIKQAGRAIAALQEYSDKEAHRRDPVALGDVLKQVSGLRAEVWAKENIEASLVLEPSPPVLAHERQLQLLVLYLLKSAERSFGRSAARKLRIHLSAVENIVRFEIHETGSRPEVTPDMAIACSIVEQHNGRIQLTSESDGELILVELPAYSGD